MLQLEFAGDAINWGDSVCLYPRHSLSPNPRVGIWGATPSEHRNFYITNATAAHRFPIEMEVLTEYYLQGVLDALSARFTTYGMYDLRKVRAVLQACP